MSTDTPVTLEKATSVERPIALRAYPVMVDGDKAPSRPRTKATTPVQLPRLALIFDCETRIDTSQRLTVGFAIVLRSDWQKNRHEMAHLICFADEAALSNLERLTIEA
jgi:hypothetical protein